MMCVSCVFVLSLLSGLIETCVLLFGCQLSTLESLCSYLGPCTFSKPQLARVVIKNNNAVHMCLEGLYQR